MKTITIYTDNTEKASALIRDYVKENTEYHNPVEYFVGNPIIEQVHFVNGDRIIRMSLAEYCSVRFDIAYVDNDIKTTDLFYDVILPCCKRQGEVRFF